MASFKQPSNPTAEPTEIPKSDCVYAFDMTGHEGYAGKYVLMQKLINEKPAWKNREKGTFLYARSYFHEWNQRWYHKWVIGKELGGLYGMAHAWVQSLECPPGVSSWNLDEDFAFAASERTHVQPNENNE